MADISDAAWKLKLGRINELSADVLQEVAGLAERISDIEEREKSQESFITFVKAMWPGFIEGAHHRIMAEAFERVARGELKRLIINMPPRHSKSEFASHMLPAWFLGQYPDKKVIQSSHTAELSKGFGRKVRDLVSSKEYSRVFPGVSLKKDSTAAARWETNQKGEYFAVGVGGAVAGKGADLYIIDDSVSEQEGKSNNPHAFESVYEWYESGPRQRLQPNGAIIIVECMIGDTDVLMGDGGHKALRDVVVGDAVATYKDGHLTTSVVENWINHGLDYILTIKTEAGVLHRANERHPFLVAQYGVLKWVRARDLKPDMQLVGMEPIELQKESGQERLARLMGVPNQSDVELSVSHITIKPTGSPEEGQDLPRSKGPHTLSIDTESHQKNSIDYWILKTESAPFASSPEVRLIPLPTGKTSCVSTTREGLIESGDSSAISVTSWSETRQRTSYSEELGTYGITLDKIKSIEPGGREDVFDIQVADTENFIANGTVVSNTRWNKADLTGRVVRKAAEREGVDDWEVIEFPAILPSGKALWPGFWSLEELMKIKNEISLFRWNAQYMQTPSSDETSIVRRSEWKKWEKPEPPDCVFIIQSWDTAFTKSTSADYSACTTWGVFYTGRIGGNSIANLILLDAYKDRLAFPDLKEKAWEKYQLYNPDSLVIETRAAGWPLIYELRERGILVSDYTPSRGEDKTVRVNATSDIFRSGLVWAPDTPWAEEVIEEFADFPSGENDDLLDSSTQALIRFRQGGFIPLPTDYIDGDNDYEPINAAYY